MRPGTSGTPSPPTPPLLEDKVAFVGVDAGSTTVKAVAVNSQEEIIFSRYLPNFRNPVPLVRQFLLELYEKYPDIQIKSAASTGYGEEIIKNAFGLDLGVVETIAHFTASQEVPARRGLQSSTSAARTSSASRLKTGPSTTSS